MINFNIGIEIGTKKIANYPHQKIKDCFKLHKIYKRNQFS